MGRASSRRAVHRAVAWASGGFRGAYRDLAQIHHTCGVRLCVSPAHLQPSTALANVLEQSVRNSLIHRIDLLTEALREARPEHPLVQPSVASANEYTLPARGSAQESIGLLVRRRESNATYQSRLREIEEKRFRQVVRVDALVKRGTPSNIAREQVGISRSAYSDWKRRLDEWSAAMRSAL